jgi:hypothetical protein
MKSWQKAQRAKHHHHSLAALLLRYSHLTQDQMATAVEADVLRMVSLMDAEAAAKVMERIAARLRASGR